MKWDVVVVGAGPAGSTTAHQLAKGGMKVLLLDKASFPREKICGDGLIPDAIHGLKALGAYEEVQSNAYATSWIDLYSSAERCLRAKSDFLVIKREKLDAILLRYASDAGAHFQEGYVRELSATEEKVTVHTDRGEEQARYVVLATGANIGLLRKLGKDYAYPANGVAIRGYFQSSYSIEALQLQIIQAPKPYHEGYGWIFPLGEGLYNVGCGVALPPNVKKQPHLPSLLEHFMGSFSVAKKMAEGGCFINKPKASILRMGLEAPLFSHPRILTVGEVMGTTFPLTGEGVGKAIETGMMAADKLLKGESIVHFSQEVHKKLRPRYLGYSLAQKWCAKPWFFDRFIQYSPYFPYCKKLVEELLQEKIDVKKRFQFPGVLQTVFLTLTSRFSKEEVS